MCCAQAATEAMANPRTSPHATVQRHPHGDGDQKRFYTKIQVPLDRRKTNGKAKKNHWGGEGSYKTFNTRMQYLWWRIYWKHLSIFILCPSYVISFSKNLSIVFDFGLLKNTRKCWCEWLQRYLSTSLGAVGSHQGRTRFAGAACCWQKYCKGYMNNRFSLWNCWNQQCYFTCIHLHIFFCVSPCHCLFYLCRNRLPIWCRK